MQQFYSFIDIGAFKISCAIVEMRDAQRPSVIGTSLKASKGIKGGLIIDVQEACKAILSAIHAAETMAKKQVNNVCVSFGAPMVHNHYLRHQMNLPHGIVRTQDLTVFLKESYETLAMTEQQPLHCFLNNYHLDHHFAGHLPVFRHGTHLSGDFHVIAANQTMIKDLNHCAHLCHVKMDNIIHNAFAAGLACLNSEERQLGAAIIDIGASSTHIGVFKDDCFIHASHIPLGGGHITQDIAQGLGISLEQAERQKCVNGSAIMSNDDRNIIDIPIYHNRDNEESLRITRSDLNAIIEPRASEILELLRDLLAKDNLRNIVGRNIIFTGGASQLSDMREAAKQILGHHVRIATPIAINGMAEAMKGSDNAVLVGMIEYQRLAMNEGHHRDLINDLNKHSRGEGLGSLWHWLKNNF